MVCGVWRAGRGSFQQLCLGDCALSPLGHCDPPSPGRKPRGASPAELRVPPHRTCAASLQKRVKAFPWENGAASARVVLEEERGLGYLPPTGFGLPSPARASPAPPPLGCRPALSAPGQSFHCSPTFFLLCFVLFPPVSVSSWQSFFPSAIASMFHWLGGRLPSPLTAPVVHWEPGEQPHRSLLRPRGRCRALRRGPSAGLSRAASRVELGVSALLYSSSEARKCHDSPQGTRGLDLERLGLAADLSASVSHSPCTSCRVLDVFLLKFNPRRV